MANEDYRELADEARQAGLEQRHRFRLEMAVRREVAEEIAQALEKLRDDNGALPLHEQMKRSPYGYMTEAIELVREIGARQ